MPKPTPNLFCFDFDNTIVDGHFHNALYDMGVASGKASPEQIALLLNKYSILNEELLLKTFRTILSNGHHLAITTWSEYPEVIVPTLQKLGLTQAEIAQIHIESGVPTSPDDRKSGHIARAKAHFGITNNANVFLVDDDEQNILKARIEGQFGLHAASPKASSDCLQNILTIINKPAPRRSIRIAELNTLEGQRLFEVRNALHAQGKRRTGKRKDEEKPLARFLAKNPEKAPVTTQIQEDVTAKINTQKQPYEPVNTKETSKDNDKKSINIKLSIAAQEQVSIILKKILLTAFMMGLLAAAASWYLAAPIYLIVTVGAMAFSLAVPNGQKLCDRMVDAATERSKDITKWKQENGGAYKLGRESAKAWLPYLKSYVQPKGYTSAYQLGLNETCIKERGLELAAAEHQTQMKPKQSQ